MTAELFARLALNFLYKLPVRHGSPPSVNHTQVDR